MAGGIFTNRPFEPNIKCIVFGVVLILFYLFIAPEPNYYIIPLIFVVAYIALAWYDFYFNCEQRLYSGTGVLGVSTLDSIFKPQRRTDASSDDAANVAEKEAHLLKGRGEQERAYLQKVYLFHTLVVAPLLLYVGIRGSETPPGVFGALLGLGSLAGLYHGYRLLVEPRDTSC
jgi:hypothetical protein